MPDWRQVIKDIYDPTINALRVTTEGSNTTTHSNMSKAKLLERAYNATEHALRHADQGAAGDAAVSLLDEEQIWKRVFDSNGKLKTSTVS